MSKGSKPSDSLDLLGEQDKVLNAIFAGWDASDPDKANTRGDAVKLAYDRGTLGKLLIEHAAVRVAAKRDIERVLRKVGQDGLADQFTSHLRRARELLDRIDELGRGVEAVGLSGSGEFAGTVSELARTMGSDLGTEPATLAPRVAAALGDERKKLRSAKYVVAHAPTHPGTTQRWYDDIPILARLHALYDHLRGYPRAVSVPYSNTRLADRYNSPP
jgi:hypothetical protein